MPGSCTTIYHAGFVYAAADDFDRLRDGAGGALGDAGRQQGKGQIAAPQVIQGELIRHGHGNRPQGGKRRIVLRRIAQMQENPVL
jgi:hypothetical protein